ncbi:hypothetical protein ABGA94_01705, partial [Stenotrophomonas sp. 3diitr2024]
LVTMASQALPEAGQGWQPPQSVGEDAPQRFTDGVRRVIDFLGQPQVEIREREQVVTTTISADALAAHRARFPAMLRRRSCGPGEAD